VAEYTFEFNGGSTQSLVPQGFKFRQPVDEEPRESRNLVDPRTFRRAAAVNYGSLGNVSKAQYQGVGVLVQIIEEPPRRRPHCCMGRIHCTSVAT
jgi:hypothetical protein